MKKLFIAVLAAGLLAFSSCVSTKPCPAYAKAPVEQPADVKG
ncbi:MAG: hypothetical protein ACXIT9_03745 [Nitritalea sp.]